MTRLELCKLAQERHRMGLTLNCPAEAVLSILEDLGEVIWALEHYESAHYAYDNKPCYHDDTAMRVLTRIRGKYE